MGEHAKLDLAVVGGDQPLALVGDEGLADGAAFARAHRDVLQIRLERRQPAGGGGGERVGGVHAARLGMDVGGQRVGIGALQLGEQAPVENFARQLVALGGELLERARVRAPGAGLGAPSSGKLILSNRISPSCLGEPMLKSSPASSRISSSSRARVCANLPERRRERRALDLDAGPLHQRQHRRDRPLQGLVHGGDVLGASRGFSTSQSLRPMSASSPAYWLPGHRHTLEGSRWLARCPSSLST